MLRRRETYQREEHKKWNMGNQREKNIRMKCKILFSKEYRE